MNELTREQSDLLNAKLIIADLTMELYRLRVELHRLNSKKGKDVGQER